MVYPEESSSFYDRREPRSSMKIKRSDVAGKRQPVQEKVVVRCVRARPCSVFAFCRDNEGCGKKKGTRGIAATWYLIRGARHEPRQVTWRFQVDKRKQTL